MNRISTVFTIVCFVLVLFTGGCSPAVHASQTAPISPTENVPAVLPSQTTPTTGTDDCKKIAFSLSDKGDTNIYTACPDGSGLTNLTQNKASNTHPAWSPDGRQIAFASTLAGGSQIYVMNADGSGLEQLTSEKINDMPIWLPDGKQIAFRTTDGKGLWWWQLITLESGKVTQYSKPAYDFFFQTPAWSRDGKYLAYMSLAEQASRNDGSSQIHVKELAQSSDRALTQDVWENINPLFSPDGKKIAFFSERDGTYNVFALYVMNVDGSDVKRLTKPMYSDTTSSASWSPDS